MTNWFYFLSIGVSVVFFITFVFAFICAFVIYFNIENTIIGTRKKNKHE
jgi:hypothetical protein